MEKGGKSSGDKKTSDSGRRSIPAPAAAPAAPAAPAATQPPNFFDEYRLKNYAKGDFTQANYIFPIIFIVLGLPLIISLVQWIFKKFAKKSTTYSDR